MALCKKCGKEVEGGQQHCSSCNEEAMKIIEEAKKEMKSNTTSHWVGIIIGGFIAGATVAILRSTGVHLGFLPAFALWLVAYLISKTVAKKVL